MRNLQGALASGALAGAMFANEIYKNIANEIKKDLEYSDYAWVIGGGLAGFLMGATAAYVAYLTLLEEEHSESEQTRAWTNNHPLDKIFQMLGFKPVEEENQLPAPGCTIQ